MDILVLVSEVTNRLEYIFDVLFKERMYVQYMFTTSEEEYLAYKGPRFVYGTNNVKGELFFESVPLLWQKEILNISPGFEIQDGLKGLFSVKSGLLSFDIFASAFYLISRYEEYLPHALDKHGRFRASDSVAKKNGFLKEPLIEVYADRITRILKAKYSDFNFDVSAPKLEVTIDIDNLFAYKYKGLKRTLGAIAKKILTLKIAGAITHISVLLGLRDDPYDTYNKMDEIHKKYGLRPIYFYLVGSQGRYDRNLDINSELVKSTLNKLKQQAEIALHPSYKSNDDIEILKDEKLQLENCIGAKITKSRQHFIKMNVPQTYRNLLAVGIKEDYSMGYASRVGFRASTSKPFSFFDLELDEKTELIVHPFFIMDTTMLKYMRMNSSKALGYAKKHLSKLFSINNVNIVYLFHNESISGRGVWKGWAEVYESMIKFVVETNKK